MLDAINTLQLEHTPRHVLFETPDRRPLGNPGFTTAIPNEILMFYSKGWFWCFAVGVCCFTPVLHQIFNVLKHFHAYRYFSGTFDFFWHFNPPRWISLRVNGPLHQNVIYIDVLLVILCCSLRFGLVWMAVLGWLLENLNVWELFVIPYQFRLGYLPQDIPTLQIHRLKKSNTDRVREGKV